MKRAKPPIVHKQKASNYSSLKSPSSKFYPKTYLQHTVQTSSQKSVVFSYNKYVLKNQNND